MLVRDFDCTVNGPKRCVGLVGSAVRYDKREERHEGEQWGPDGSTLIRPWCFITFALWVVAPPIASWIHAFSWRYSTPCVLREARIFACGVRPVPSSIDPIQDSCNIIGRRWGVSAFSETPRSRYKEFVRFRSFPRPKSASDMMDHVCGPLKGETIPRKPVFGRFLRPGR